MKPKTFMLIAGEASGDLLAAELVAALKQSEDGRAPQFFGAGGFTNLLNGCNNEP